MSSRKNASFCILVNSQIDVTLNAEEEEEDSKYQIMFPLQPSMSVILLSLTFALKSFMELWKYKTHREIISHSLFNRLKV